MQQGQPFQKNQKIPVTYTFDEKQMFSDSIKQKEISFTSSVTQPISTYEIATVWNTSKDIRRKVSFSFEKAVTDHQLSVIKKQFKGQTIDSVNLDGYQNVTLSFVQKGSVSDCNKDFSALFPNSLMKSQAHFSFAGGKKVTFSDKISFETLLYCIQI